MTRCLARWLLNIEKHERNEWNGLCGYRRHGGSVPFRKGCHGSGGVCIPLAEPAGISLPLIRTFGICFGIHAPRLRRTPLREGTRGGGPSVVTLWNIDRFGIMEHRKTRKTRIGWTVWMQAARRQRPLLTGVPREWRGMYTAGGASTNEDSSYKDYWYLISDTYPPASPYPSKRGDSRWRCVGLKSVCLSTLWLGEKLMFVKSVSRFWGLCVI